MLFKCLAPPPLAFQLFAGQTIQLLNFCTKNKVVVVVAQDDEDEDDDKDC